MTDVTAKLAEALALITKTDPIDAALDPQRALRVAREALAAYEAAPAEPLWYDFTLDEVKARLQCLNVDNLRGLVVSLLITQRIERKALAATPAPAPAEAQQDERANSLLIGQAQQLIGALMNHGLVARSLPEDQYLKLWDVVKRQLRCVNQEGARAALAAMPAPGTKLYAAPVAQAEQWQPIETAPNDRKVLVWFSALYGGMADIAKLEEDKYAKKPRPYWSGYFERVLGIVAYRNGKPTHWMPLPQPPKEQP